MQCLAVRRSLARGARPTPDPGTPPYAPGPGRPAAVLISPDDLAALEETVDILTTPGAPEAIAEGLADLTAGRVADNDALCARFAPR